MWSVIKKLRGIIIFAATESYFYYKLKPKDLEMFFMVWAIISLFLLLYNIFNVTSDFSIANFDPRGISSDRTDQTGWLLEKMYGTDKSKTRNYGGLFDPINLLYLVFLIANVIGYMIVMPK